MYHEHSTPIQKGRARRSLRNSRKSIKQTSWYRDTLMNDENKVEPKSRKRSRKKMKEEEEFVLPNQEEDELDHIISDEDVLNEEEFDLEKSAKTLENRNDTELIENDSEFDHSNVSIAEEEYRLKEGADDGDDDDIEPEIVYIDSSDDEEEVIVELEHPRKINGEIENPKNMKIPTQYLKPQKCEERLKGLSENNSENPDVVNDPERFLCDRVMWKNTSLSLYNSSNPKRKRIDNEIIDRDLSRPRKKSRKIANSEHVKELEDFKSLMFNFHNNITKQ